MTQPDCSCLKLPIDYSNFTSSYLGVDHTNGRYADISVEQCKLCNRKWLRYFVEYESFSKSGRWYLGIISDEDLLEMTPENSIAYIENLDWYFYGGSYFSSVGAIGKGKAIVDL
jgi:hypothetical protein